MSRRTFDDFKFELFFSKGIVKCQNILYCLMLVSKQNINMSIYKFTAAKILCIHLYNSSPVVFIIKF